MRYRRESKLERVIKWISRTVVKLIVFALILLITVQFILTNATLEKSLLSKMPYSEYILNFGQENKFSQAAKTVFAPEKGSLIFKLHGAQKPWQIKLLVNQKVVGDFTGSYLKAEVRPGDKIAIDARGCKAGMWLILTDLSQNIDFFKEGRQFWIRNEYKSLGRVNSNTKF